MGTSYLELINQWGWNNYLRRKKSPYAPTSHQTEEINPLEMKTKRIKANFKTHQGKSGEKLWDLLEASAGVSESARWSRAGARRDTEAESLSLASLDSSTAGHGERQGHKLRGLPSGSQARRGHRGGDAHPSVAGLKICVLCFQSRTWERPHSFCPRFCSPGQSRAPGSRRGSGKGPSFCLSEERKRWGNT